MVEIPKTMRACAAFGPGDIRLVELPVPEPDDYEVLVKNEGCLFCNSTDRMIIDDLFAAPSYPLIFGHESFGKVVKVGKKVTKFKLGDRVICTSGIKGYDGEYYSVWSGFSEYGIAGDWSAYRADRRRLTEKNLYRRRYRHNETIPTELTPQQAGLAFSLAETSSALAQVGDLKGKNVLVIGTGFVGLSFVMFAKLCGAQTVACLGRREERVRIARQLGADVTFLDHDEASSYLACHGGADVILEASGNHHVTEKGFPCLNREGIFAVYAMPKQPYIFDLRYCPADFSVRRIEPRVGETLPQVCQSLLDGKIPVDVFLTHEWPLDRMREAYESVCRGEVIKGMIRFDSEETV